MPERLSRYEQTRWGTEVTKGTPPGSAFKRLLELSLDLAPEAEVDQFIPAGWAVPTVYTPDKELTRATLTGRFGFNSVVWPLSAAFGAATITTPGGGTNSRQWQWTLAANSEIDPKTFTWEKGSAAYADKTVYGSLGRFGFDWKRGPIEVSGDGFGQPLQTGITLTAGSLGDIATQLAFGKDVNVYLDSTAGAIGTSLLTRAISGSWEFGTGRGPAFYVNASTEDFAHTVDGEAPRAINLVHQANASGMALLQNMRDGVTRFMRIELTGPIIEAAIAYKAHFDCAIKYEAPSHSDQDGVYAVEFPAGIVYDAGWAKAVQITVTNTVTGL